MDKGVLTITDTFRKRGKKYYKVVCSRCHTLGFYEKPLDIYYLSYEQGSYPCLCSNFPKFDNELWTKVINNLAGELGYVVSILNKDSEKITVNTMLELYNPSTGNKWITSISHFYSGGRTHDPSLKNARTVRVANQLTKFRSMHENDTRFKTIFYKDDNYYHTCDVCSYDDFVKEGLCDGVFKTSSTNLRRGVCGCRCAKAIRWTKEQVKYRVEKALQSKGKLLKIFFNKDLSYTKVDWECDCGEKHNTSLDSVLNGENCCNSCRVYENYSYGKYPDRPKDPDNLYLIASGDYLKVGRSFDHCLNDRLSYMRRNLPTYNLIGLVKATHEEIFELEQNILKLWKVRTPFNFTKEVCLLSNLKDITYYIERSGYGILYS